MHVQQFVNLVVSLHRPVGHVISENLCRLGQVIKTDQFEGRRLRIHNFHVVQIFLFESLLVVAQTGNPTQHEIAVLPSLFTNKPEPDIQNGRPGAFAPVPRVNRQVGPFVFAQPASGVASLVSQNGQGSRP